MSPTERAFWLRVNRKAATLEPALAAAILRAYQRLAAAIGEAALARLIASGGADALFERWLTAAVLDGNLAPVQALLQRDLEAGAAYAARTLPAWAGGAAGVVRFGFNVLNPQVMAAIRQLDAKIMTTLKDDVRETVRQMVGEGLHQGLHPRVIARDLRGVLGLAPNQAAAVRNFRTMLEAGDREALTRALRDHRFDATLARALGPGGTGLSAEQIDRMVGAYGRRMLAFNAETNARTAVLDSLKLGQRLTWGAAIERGDVDGGRLRRRWRGVRDSREREEHWEMDFRADQGEAPRFDEPYSNGEMVPGESTFNCRCIDVFFLAPMGQT